MCKEVVIKIVVALKIVDGSQKKVYFCKCISHLQQLLVSYALL